MNPGTQEPAKESQGFQGLKQSYSQITSNPSIQEQHHNLSSSNTEKAKWTRCNFAACNTFN